MSRLSHSNAQQFNVSPLDVNDRDYELIREYFDNSMDEFNESLYAIDVFKVDYMDKSGDLKTTNGNQDDNRYLLWHGTKRDNIFNILTNGLRLPSRSVNGHCLGPGIYFTDSAVKASAFTDRDGPMVMLLCQVVVGKKYKVYEYQTYDGVPNGFDSILGVGRYGPEKLFKWKDNCLVPSGDTVPNPELVQPTRHSSIQYNEYVVFDQDRMRLEFIVLFKRFERPMKSIDSSQEVIRCLLLLVVEIIKLKTANIIDGRLWDLALNLSI